MQEEQYKNFTEIDFETIRDSIKDHLKSQDIFKDYNFDGSAISTLLDVLAYNTQYNAYYMNMTSSEKFLNRAQKRKSVVELANNYGYVPYSSKSSTSYLSFEIFPEPNHIGDIILPKNLKFVTNNNGETYSFLSTSTISVPKIDNRYIVMDYEVKEGKYFKNKFDVTQYTKFYTILNKNVDIDRLKVYIKPSSTSPDNTAIEYFYYESILDVDKQSNVYFIQETDNEKFEIYFGDGILGKKPDIGSQVIIEYYVTKSDEPNGAKDFVLEEDVTGLESVSSIVAERASNGAKIETIDSIRFSTRDKYKSQNRAVIDKDFKTKVKQIVPDATDISVWGGENATPKQYGKVFICLVKENLQKFTSVQKNNLLSKLKNDYMVMGITPEIVDYDFCNLVLNIDITKVKNQTRNDSEIVSIVKSSIDTNIKKSLEMFNSSVYESKIEEFINYVDSNIMANTTRFLLYKNIDEVIINNGINEIGFPVAITENSINSSQFNYMNSSVNIKDDGNGNISIYNSDYNVLSNIATVDYNSGIIKINNSKLFYDIINNKGVKLYTTPLLSDLNITKKYILKLDSSDILVKINAQ